MRYFITFSCYGAHLHGDQAGSVDRNHNVFGHWLAEVSEVRLGLKKRQMDQAPYFLDQERRMIVLAALRYGCSYRGWTLLAAHVRTNHVHVVVEAAVRPEIVLNALKAYSSRDLNRAGFDNTQRKRWARHGSTRWLWKDASVQEAIRYVVSGQGEPMEVYLAELL
jgi:REP element-mobilizing transposase RayT